MTLGMCIHSVTQGRTLERLVRFSPLIGTRLSLFFVQEQQHYRLASLDHQCDSVKPRQYTDAGLASLLGFCRWLAGGKSLQPLSVEFTYPEREDISEHQRLFGSELRFGAAYDSILFDGQALLRPLSMANESLAVLHDSFAEAQLDLLYGFTIVCRIRALITERLSQGQGLCDMESIAAALNISKRTLQRALEKDGAQFKDVLNDVRRQLADFYLRHSHFNMKHVTHLLGFHDHSSFHKACTRWFGMTPGQYRVDESQLNVKEATKRNYSPGMSSGEYKRVVKWDAITQAAFAADTELTLPDNRFEGASTLSGPPRRTNASFAASLSPALFIPGSNTAY